MSKTSPIVVLDPGHGPYSNPYPAASGFYEGTQMYKLMLALKPKLEANGITVIVTRKNINENPDLPVRGRTAGNNKADLFISLHSDALDNSVSSACGVSAYYSITDTKTNKPLAAKISSSVAKLMGTRDRGALQRIGNGNADYYGVIRNSAASGCKNAFLIEHGFHSNATDVKWLISDTKLEQIADVEAKIICEYFGKTYVSTSGTSNTIDATPDTSSDSTKKVTIYKVLNKYTSAANAIAGDTSLSCGVLSIGTYYIYKEYKTATNLTKTAGVPGSWVVIGNAASSVPNMPIDENVPAIQTITTTSKHTIYTSSEDATNLRNCVMNNNTPRYYEAGKYYVYKKLNANIVNVATKPDTAGAWINLSEKITEATVSFNKGDTVVFKSGETPKYSDGTVIPMTVIAHVNGLRSTLVIKNENDMLTLTDITKTIATKYFTVVAKATEESIAKANSYTEVKVTKDDISEVLETKFGSLTILANTDGYKEFAKYMEGLIDDDSSINGTTDFEFIMGSSVLTAAQLTTYIKKYNADFDPSIATAFIDIGKIYGIRGDVACCQSILETGWFKFIGSSVKPEQHNYCGLGATGNGAPGCNFATVEAGVEAQIQHLFAYASTNEVPSGRTLYDPRFKYVTRGCAPRWVDLNLKWCSGSDYGEKILAIYQKACI